MRDFFGLLRRNMGKLAAFVLAGILPKCIKWAISNLLGDAFVSRAKAILSQHKISDGLLRVLTVVADYPFATIILLAVMVIVISAIASTVGVRHNGKNYHTEVDSRQGGTLPAAPHPNLICYDPVWKTMILNNESKKVITIPVRNDVLHNADTATYARAFLELAPYDEEYRMKSPQGRDRCTLYECSKRGVDRRCVSVLAHRTVRNQTSYFSRSRSWSVLHY